MWWLRQPEDSCQPLLLRLIRTHLSASPFKLVPWVLGHLPDPVLQGASCSETKSPGPALTAVAHRKLKSRWQEEGSEPVRVKPRPSDLRLWPQ